LSSVSASSTATSSESVSALVLSVPDSSTSASVPFSSGASFSDSASTPASSATASSRSLSAPSSSTSASLGSVRFSATTTVSVSYRDSITCLEASPLEYAFQSSENDCTLSNLKFSSQIVSIN